MRVAVPLLVMTAAILSEACDDHRVRNLTGAFLEFYEASQELPEREKIERFKSTVYTADPSVYDHVFQEWKSIGRDPDEELLRQLDRFSDYKDRYVALSETVSDQLASSLRTFRGRFADFDNTFEVHLIHSLGLADGTRRTIEEKEIFIVGLDMIARYHDWEDNTAFFHHELTHFYLHQHYQASSEGELSPDGLYNMLWDDGVATYVSHALNPHATYQELMLEIPSSIPELADPILDQIAARLLEDLYSTDWDVKRQYFAMRSEDPVIPKRAGYYLGYLLVKQMAESHGLDELIRMKDKDFVPKLEDQLLEMKERGQ